MSLAVAIVACGGGEILEPRPRNLPASAISTSTTTNETTSAATPSTTAPVTPAPGLSGDEVPADGDTGLTAGDCFTQTETDGQTTRTVVPCGEPHYGEVIATGPTACPIEISESDFEGLMSGYVGVSPSDLPEWMAQEGVGAISQVQFDDDGLLTGTLCALMAEDGELTHSYRVALPGTRSQPPVIE